MRNLSDDEIHEHAVKLLDAIKNNTNSAYDEWTSITAENAGHESHAAWVKKATGLQKDPTPEDLKAMCDHSSTTLKDQVADMRKTRPNAVGSFCGVES